MAGQTQSRTSQQNQWQVLSLPRLARLVSLILPWRPQGPACGSASPQEFQASGSPLGQEPAGLVLPKNCAAITRLTEPLMAARGTHKHPSALPRAQQSLTGWAFQNKSPQPRGQCQQLLCCPCTPTASSAGQPWHLPGRDGAGAWQELKGRQPRGKGDTATVHWTDSLITLPTRTPCACCLLR